MDMTPDKAGQLLTKLAAQLKRTRQDELDCDECFELLDEYAEAVQRGEEAGDLMSTVRAHLELCQDCGEEFEALARALEEMD